MRIAWTVGCAVVLVALSSRMGFGQSLKERTAELNRAAAVTLGKFVKKFPCPSHVPLAWTRLDSGMGSGWRCSLLVASWDTLMKARLSNKELIAWKFKEVSCAGIIESQVAEIDLDEKGRPSKTSDGTWTVQFFNEDPPAGSVGIDKRTGRISGAWAASGEFFPDYLHGCKSLPRKP